MKSVNIRLNEEEAKILDILCKENSKSKSEIMRDALILMSKSNNNQNRELQEAENKNKQLAFAIDSLKAVLQENREKYDSLDKAKQEQSGLYERMLQDLNVDKTNMQDLIQQLKTACQRKGAEVDLLQGKVEEIKKAGLFKRLFLKLA